TAFNDLDRRLASNSYCFGDKLSIIDIAWFVYASRLHLGGYPFERLHLHVHAWRKGLVGDDRFDREVRLKDGVQSMMARNHAVWIQAGTTLADVAGL
ncbi:MAG: glutathione S-transferase domain-containing protein, partial [Alphaproteobacteria bacterium]